LIARRINYANLSTDFSYLGRPLGSTNSKGRRLNFQIPPVGKFDDPEALFASS